MGRSENIQVALRVRPLNAKEAQDQDPQIWNVSEKTVSLQEAFLQVLKDTNRLAGNLESFNYGKDYSDFCFKDSSNFQLYKGVASKAVSAFLKGYNSTIFAYGQTGSGKTYTMMGNKSNELVCNEEKGIVLHGLEHIYSEVSQTSDKDFQMSCSYIEIYNEQVYDLLGSSKFKGDILSVNEDPQRGFYVKNLSCPSFQRIEEVMEFIEIGEENRRTAATAMNHQSSRSHTIFQVHAKAVSYIEESTFTTQSVINFVDLAGSERVSNLQSDKLLKEGKHINTSLFYLCQVINTLSDAQSKRHVPYRNSKLTKILRSSLGGNSLTSMICTVTPTLSQFEMTLSTLRFGGRAKKITNKVEANIRTDSNAELIMAYQRDIEQLKKELEALKRTPSQVLFKRHDRVIWQETSGDLITQAEPKFQTEVTSFDSQGLFAYERMKSMHEELICSLCEKEELTQEKADLQSKLTKLKQQKHFLETQVGSKDSEIQQLKVSLETSNRKLKILENQENLEILSHTQLRNLEKFLFNAIDKIKNYRIRTKQALVDSPVKFSWSPESPKVSEFSLY